MVFDPDRPICKGDYLMISEEAREEISRHIGPIHRGPYRSLGAYTIYDDPNTYIDIGFGRNYGVNETHAQLVEPPAIQKETRPLEGWQRRRDENLRKLFTVPRGEL